MLETNFAGARRAYETKFYSTTSGVVWVAAVAGRDRGRGGGKGALSSQCSRAVRVSEGGLTRGMRAERAFREC